MNNKIKKIFLVIFIIILFVGIGYTNGNSRKVTMIESIFSSIITIPQKGYIYIKNWIMKDSSFFETVDSLNSQNEALKEENNELKAKQINYELIMSENTILKNQINLKNNYTEYSTVVAEIINESTSNWEKVYTINRGANDGIKPNMTVIAEEGLVGYIESVTDNTAKIVSILDPGNTVSSRTTRTRDSVTCKGNSGLISENEIKLTKMPTDLSLVEGDKIETSGLGGRYPKGIPIGEVVKFNVKKNPVENDAIVKTYVDFNKLETVAIICEDF